MRAAPLLAALLLAPSGWAQTAEVSGAERPPERPSAETPAPTPAAPSPAPVREDQPRPPDARPPSPQEGLTPPEAPDPEAAPTPSKPRPPAGPPRRELLRETDFDFSACLLALHVMGARYQIVPQITGEPRDCGIARPIRLTEALPGLMLEGAPAMRCETARALGWWLRDHVIPAATRLPGAPRPVALALGAAYHCRGVVGGSGEGAALSEHAFGNALDIAAIGFDAGPPVEIEQSGGSDLRAAFIAAIRGTACLYFTTVLGPGSNTAHEDHLHLDIKARRGGYRICQ